MKEFPKLLIYGQPFDDVTGGGITLSNLFTGWQKDKVAVAVTGHFLYYVKQDICDTYYQLGEEEQKWIFPFSLFQKKFPSGLKTFNSTEPIINSKQKGSLRNLFVNSLFYPLLSWLGLFHIASKISLSKKFKDWLKEYGPEVLYIQVNNRETVLFASKLIDYLKIPVVIHMMDDWPATISSHGPFKHFWKRKIDKEFKQLLNKINLHLSISDAMSEEYKKRYQQEFIGFHNPIDTSKFKPIEVNKDKESDIFKILYVGRIGLANIHSVDSFANALSTYKSDRKIELDIYTPDIDTHETKKVGEIGCVNLKHPIAHGLIPALLSEYDMLFLPLDFTKMGLKYAQFSIPTKASEFMISGVPILVFAPKETATSKFFMQHKCGYCVTNNNKEELWKALDTLINDKAYRQEISDKAIKIAKDRFEATKVRNEFQGLITDLKPKA